MNDTFLKTAGALVAIALLGGCTVGPAYQDPSEPIRQEELAELHFSRDENLWKEAAPADTLVKGDWWAVFNDPELARLLEQCRLDNPDLASAFYRMEQAREAAQMTESELYPWADGTASFSRTGTSKNTGSYRGTFNEWRIGVGLTWDADLFGRIRSLLRAETANAQALRDAYQNTLLMLQSEVSITYFTLRQHRSEVILLQRTVQVRKEQSEFMRTQLRLDYANELDLQRALQSEYEADAQLSAVLRQLAIAENYMATLIGTVPSKLKLENTELGEDLPKLPDAVPSQLLERRPDVAAAERQVYAANAQIGAATAAFFPTVSITGSTELASSDIDQLLNASSFAWGVRPQIYIPIFQAGRLSAQRRVMLALHKQTLEDYRSTVITAIREVEDALTNVNHLAREYERRSAVSDASLKVEKLTRKKYDLGAADYFEVSDAQRLALANERECIRLKGDRFRAYVLLIASIGGGWDVNDPETAKAPPQQKK